MVVGVSTVGCETVVGFPVGASVTSIESDEITVTLVMVDTRSHVDARLLSRPRTSSMIDWIDLVASSP